MSTEKKWQATRELHDSTDPNVKVEVSLGFPEARTPDEWACPFRIVGLDAEIIESGIGVDAFQALMMAIEGIATFLRASGRKLSWIGLPGETGIRRQIPMYMGAEFADEIEAHIDAKIEAHIRSTENALNSEYLA